MRDGRIEIEPAPLEVDLVEVDGLVVAVPRRPVEVMPEGLVDQVLQQLRELA